MGFFSLMPVLTMALIFLGGGHPAPDDAALTATAADPTFDWITAAQTLAAATVLIAGMRLARGSRRRG